MITTPIFLDLVTYAVPDGMQLAEMYTSKYSKGVGEPDTSEVKEAELHEGCVCPREGALVSGWRTPPFH